MLIIPQLLNFIEETFIQTVYITSLHICQPKTWLNKTDIHPYLFQFYKYNTFYYENKLY